MKSWKLPALLNTPLGLVVALGSLIAAVELLLMVTIQDVIASLNIPNNYWNFIDTILLTLIVAPALYLLVFRKMHESEERFRQINSSVQDAIIVIDEQGRITEWNLAAQQMFQYSSEEALGQPMHQLLAPPRHHADAARGFGLFQESGTGPLIGKTTEVAALRKDGSEFPIELSISAAKVKGRWHAMGVMRDITGRKRAETQLKNSEQRYRDIIQTSMDCFWLIDTEGRILDVNDAYCQLSGYTREELLNMRIPDVEAQETPEVTARHIHTIMTQGYARFATQHRRKDGQLLDIEVSVIYQQDTEGGHFFVFLHDITERKQIEEKIRNLAFHDTLTQLPNRRLLNDRLAQTMAASKRSGRYGALMFLDLDNFKPLNDAHGHDTGDLLLIEVARRITRCVRETDTVARFGGDEFVVMLGELDEDKAASAAQAEIVAEKIRTTLSEPYVLTIRQEGNVETTVEHRCTSSIGMVLFINHEASPEDILKWADMAMYQAKKGGRNRVRFFDQAASEA